MSFIKSRKRSLDLGSSRRASVSSPCSLATRSRNDFLSISRVLEESILEVQRTLLCHSLGSQSGYFHITRPRRCNSRMNGGVRIVEVLVGPVGRIHDHQAATRKSDPGIVRMNGEISEQHFRNLQRLEPRMHHATLCRAADRIPNEENDARPAMIAIRKRLQRPFHF